MKALALALSIVFGGCTLATVGGQQIATPTRDNRADCGDLTLPIMVDLAAVVSTITLIAIIPKSTSTTKEELRAAAVIGSFALFGFSALYGFVQLGDCKSG